MSKQASTIQNLGLASYEMSVSINRAQRAFNELLKTCLSHQGLTIPEWSLLGKLYSAGSMRPREVAQFLGIKAPFTAKLIAAMEYRDFITSIPYPDDERGKHIMLTATGKVTVQDVEVKLEDCLNHQFGNVDSTSLKTYFELTNYIAQNVHHH